jgi:hypothetical protein
VVMHSCVERSQSFTVVSSDPDRTWGVWGEKWVVWTGLGLAVFRCSWV